MAEGNILLSQWVAFRMEVLGSSQMLHGSGLLSIEANMKENKSLLRIGQDCLCSFQSPWLSKQTER